MSVNKAIILGNCGNDPEIRQNQNGEDIANFSIATSESWKDKNSGEKKEKTEWHKIVVFGALAGIVKNYVKKGSKLYIEGRLQTKKWIDKDGVEKYTTEIILNGFSAKIEILNRVDEEISQHSKDKGNGYQAQVEESEEESSDEIPF